MSLLGSLLKLYAEVGGVILAAWFFFTLFRKIFETWIAAVSPSVLIRIAQALVFGSLVLSVVIHLIPQSQLEIVKFELPSENGETLLPLIRKSTTPAVRITNPRILKVRSNRIGIVKQRIRGFIEEFSNQSSLGILALLILGWSLMGIRLFRQTRSLRNLLSRSLLIRKVGLTQILVTDEVAVPFSTLMHRIAYIVLPMDMASDGPSFRLAALHELQHHRHRDTAWARLIEFVVALYFWNPGIYLWKDEIIQLQELACDETLIGQKRVSPQQYGNCLLKVAEAALVRHDMRIGTICMAMTTKNPKRHVSFLRRRIGMFAMHESSKRKFALGLTLGTASLLLTTAAAFGAQQFLKATELPAPNPGVARFDPVVQSIARTALTKYVKKFNAKAGFILVSEVSTGRLLAAANISDDSTAAANWALAYELEPASAMKVPIAASALDQGATFPDETHDCAKGVATIGHGTYRDWKSFGRLTTSEAIIQSSNICSIRIAQKLGTAAVAQSLNDFGFGVGGTTAGFPQARAGEIPDPSLYPADDYLSVITLGANAVPHFHITPLEMVQAIGAIANEGRLMKAIPADAPDSSIQVVRQAVSQTTSGEMKAILRRAVLEGTGRPAESALYTTAGKTSSAAANGKDHDGSGDDRSMAGFVGFAPLAKPKVVVYVGVLDPHEKNDPDAHGSRQAAPAFREVIEGVLQHMGVEPDITSLKDQLPEKR